MDIGEFVAKFRRLKPKYGLAFETSYEVAYVTSLYDI